MKELGDGRLGIVLSAHNINGYLSAEYNHDSDIGYAKDIISNGTGDIVRSSTGLNDTAFIKNILGKFENFASKPLLPYPIGGLGTNSNSFNQGLLRMSEGEGFSENMKGYDPGSDHHNVDSMFNSSGELSTSFRSTPIE